MHETTITRGKRCDWLRVEVARSFTGAASSSKNQRVSIMMFQEEKHMIAQKNHPNGKKKFFSLVIYFSLSVP